MAQSALRALTQQLMQGGPAPAGMASAQTAIQNAAQRPQPKPMGQQVADVLGGVALPLSAVPVVGDIAGLGADAAMYANYPEERTALNYGLTLAGMLPFVPGAAGIRAAEGALDMSQAARMQRAGEQGFSPSRPFFHGTASDVVQFDPGMRGASTGAESAKKADWFVSSPDTASGYADLAAKRELHQTLSAWQKAMDEQKFEVADELMQKAESLDSAATTSGQNIIKVLTRGKIKTIDAKGKSWAQLQDGGLSAILDSAKKEGFDGVEFRALRDDATSFGGGRPATHLAMFDPSNIRSVNAAFDPTKRGSANLSAGIMGGAVGLSALRQLMPQQEQE